MEINNKYSLNDTVWYIEDNKVKSTKIKRIQVVCSSAICSIHVIITYTIENANKPYFNENELFATKQDLLNSL